MRLISSRNDILLDQQSDFIVVFFELEVFCLFEALVPNLKWCVYASPEFSRKGSVKRWALASKRQYTSTTNPKYNDDITLRI